MTYEKQSTQSLIDSLVSQGCTITRDDGYVISHSEYRIGRIDMGEEYLVTPRSGDSFGSKESEFFLDSIKTITVTPESRFKMRIEMIRGELYIFKELSKVSGPVDISAPEWDTSARFSIDKVVNILPVLVPDIDDMLWFDELSGLGVVDTTRLHAYLPDTKDSGVVKMTEHIRKSLHVMLQAQLTRIGFKHHPSKEMVYDTIDYKIGLRRRNSFIDRISEVEWDGTPRVRTWFIELFGATAPALAEMENGAELERQYLEEVSLRWFMGGIARNLPDHENRTHEIIPVLIGPQGIGKSGGLKYTGLGPKTKATQDIAKKGYYVSTSVDADDGRELLESMAGAVVCELAESTQFRSKSNERLKAFISAEADTYRKAYAHEAEDFERHFIMAATSNITDVFTDSTGNRRFYPMHCDPSRITRDFKKDPISEAEQVWAEALFIFEIEAERQFISEEGDRLAKIMQEDAHSIPDEVVLIDDIMNRDSRSMTIGCKISISEFYEIVQGDERFVRNEAVKKAKRLWERNTKYWKATNTTRDGIHGRYYQRVLESPYTEPDRGLIY